MGNGRRKAWPRSPNPDDRVADEILEEEPDDLRQDEDHRLNDSLLDEMEEKLFEQLEGSG